MGHRRRMNEQVPAAYHSSDTSRQSYSNREVYELDIDDIPVYYPDLPATRSPHYKTRPPQSEAPRDSIMSYEVSTQEDISDEDTSEDNGHLRHQCTSFETGMNHNDQGVFHHDWNCKKRKVENEDGHVRSSPSEKRHRIYARPAPPNHTSSLGRNPYPLDPSAYRYGTQHNPLEIEDSPPPERPQPRSPIILPDTPPRPHRAPIFLDLTPKTEHKQSPISYTPRNGYESCPQYPANPTFDSDDSEMPSNSTFVPHDTNVIPKDIVPITEPPLCPEQARLVDLVMSGRNVFYTGSAGCGKSTVLKSFVRKLKEKGVQYNIVAPTGRAALDIKGTTTWTYAGWNPDSHKKSLDELRNGAHSKTTWKRMRNTDVLIFDEISMVENLHFERLNHIMKEVRANDKPFGGVQVIVTGDFCQLPPVKPFQHCIQCGRDLKPIKGGTEYSCPQHGIYYDIDKWAFRSQAWEECNFAHVNLTTIHRQSDEEFISMLQKLRLGKRLTNQEIHRLENHECDTRGAIQLFSTRGEVKRMNDEKFNQLPHPPQTFRAVDYFECKHVSQKYKGDRIYNGSLKAMGEHRYEYDVRLKLGMRVVLLNNLDIREGLVNGSQGVIQGFEPFSLLQPSPPSGPNDLVPGKDYTPLNGVISQQNPAANGRSVHISTYGVLEQSGEYELLKIQQIREYMEAAEYKGWPIVRFQNGIKKTIQADCSINEIGDEKPYSLIARTQIPLMAAWAITTHKSQGMTLNRVKVDLSRSFEQGQAYVALSRARSLKGLEVVKFPPNAQGEGNKQVREFLREKFGIE